MVPPSSSLGAAEVSSSLRVSASQVTVDLAEWQGEEMAGVSEEMWEEAWEDEEVEKVEAVEEVESLASPPSVPTSTRIMHIWPMSMDFAKEGSNPSSGMWLQCR